MVETQLFFGMSKPKGGTVSGRDWDAFVAREVSPRFPEGFSVIDGAGFWRDGATPEDDLGEEQGGRAAASGVGGGGSGDRRDRRCV